MTVPRSIITVLIESALRRVRLAAVVLLWLALIPLRRVGLVRVLILLIELGLALELAFS